MAYTTPITDRDAADIAAQNSKAFWNVADWTRVYDNSSATNTHINSEFGASIPFYACTTPTNTTIPTVADFNEFLANIERIRVWVVANVVYYPSALDTGIEDSYTAGQSETSPNYTNANRWESHLDLMYNLVLDSYSVISQDSDFVTSQSGDFLVSQ